MLYYPISLDFVWTFQIGSVLLGCPDWCLRNILDDARRVLLLLADAVHETLEGWIHNSFQAYMVICSQTLVEVRFEESEG